MTRFNKIKSVLFFGVFFVLTSCASGSLGNVKADNFATVKANADAFVYGSYNLDVDRSLKLILKQKYTTDVMLIRGNNTLGQISFFLIPVSGKNGYVVNGIKYSEGYVAERGSSLYPNSGYFAYTSPEKIQNGKINYIGRFTMKEGNLTVINTLDEDKALLLANFESNPAAHSELSKSDFVNLVK